KWMNQQWNWFCRVLPAHSSPLTVPVLCVGDYRRPSTSASTFRLRAKTTASEYASAFRNLDQVLPIGIWGPNFPVEMLT
ncbi:unnamed protein product, partial [Symbiodinium sp. KB8]